MIGPILIKRFVSLVEAIAHRVFDERMARDSWAARKEAETRQIEELVEFMKVEAEKEFWE